MCIYIIIFNYIYNYIYITIYIYIYITIYVYRNCMLLIRSGIFELSIQVWGYFFKARPNLWSCRHRKWPSYDPVVDPVAIHLDCQAQLGRADRQHLILCTKWLVPTEGANVWDVGKQFHPVIYIYIYRYIIIYVQLPRFARACRRPSSYVLKTW